MTFLRVTAFAAALAAVTITPLAAQETYKRPPQNVIDVLDAPVTPQAAVSPANDVMVLLDAVRYPPISEVSQPMHRLAGLRINPATNGPHRANYFTAISVKKIADGTSVKVVMPAGARIGLPRWSSDGKAYAFTNTVQNGIELWVGDAAGKARKIAGVTLNAAYGDPIRWADARTLLVQTIRAGRGSAPATPQVPAGPNVQETSGRPGPVRTYQDMLKSPHDEALFEHYATSQLAFVDTATGKVTPVGKPAIFQTAEVSPDGRHVLVARVARPYSYLHPANAFPKEVEIWDRAGAVVHHLASLPMADRVPSGGALEGPRSYRWVPYDPSTLVYAEALDGGNPANAAPHRDRVVTIRPPFKNAPIELYKVQHRFAGIEFAEKSPIAFIREIDRDRKWTKTFAVDVISGGATAKEVWSLNTQDRYRDPGDPVMQTAPGGRVMAQSGDFVFLTGAGASSEGERPFIDRLNLKTLKSERLFRSEWTAYEMVVGLASDDGSQILTRKESPTEPPNYFVRSTGPGATAPRALTQFKDPTPILRKVKKELITYKRADGVNLSFTLYLPPDYKPGTKLPTVVWAYPTEYSDPEVAGQVAGSAARFTTITGASELFYALQGYALLHNASIPIIGDPKTVNDTYIDQLRAGAKAAIDKAVEMGVTDPNRVGVGGHSYGGFMTMNLLAHTDLFRTGVARSGAYNRTLTPFGFQNEDRTLWEAEETYLKMSPFMVADQVKEPVLMIHGEADDNTGTFPIQSERMYQALRGHGATARLVMLPNEAHGYAARESIEHTLYEMISWFERYVKDVQPPAKTSGSDKP